MEPSSPLKLAQVRGQNAKANSEVDLDAVVAETVKLWRKARLEYDQSKQVVERARRILELEAPAKRRKVVARLEAAEVERLIGAAYHLSSPLPYYGLMVKTLFYTGARVSEFVHLRAQDVTLEGDEPQIYIHKAKKDSVRYVPILPALAQELKIHLDGRTRGYLFESNRSDKYTPRAVQLMVKAAADKAKIAKRVYPHLVRHSVAQILYDNGMPLEQLQKFLGHQNLQTTLIYAEASLKHVGENYRRALGKG